MGPLKNKKPPTSGARGGFGVFQIYSELRDVSTLGKLRRVAVALLKKPEEGSVKQCPATICQEVVELNRPPRNKTLMIFIEHTVGRAKDQGAHQGIRSQQRKFRLMKKGPARKPAKDEIDGSMNNLIGPRWELEPKVKTRLRGEKIDEESP